MPGGADAKRHRLCALRLEPPHHRTDFRRAAFGHDIEHIIKIGLGRGWRAGGDVIRRHRRVIVDLYLDGRFITILFLVTPPALGLIAFSLLRAAVDRRDVLIIGETGLTLRPNGLFFNVGDPIHVPWTELDQVTAYDHAYGSGSLTFVKFSGTKHTINAGQLGVLMQTLLDLITERLAARGTATTRRQRYLFFANRTDLVRDGDT